MANKSPQTWNSFDASGAFLRFSGGPALKEPNNKLSFAFCRLRASYYCSNIKTRRAECRTLDVIVFPLGNTTIFEPVERRITKRKVDLAE